MRGRERDGLEGAVAELAERQHGKLSRAQLRELGLGEKAIDYRIAKGWLRPDYRAVYSLGHRPRSREGRWMAAVLYGGEGSVLSYWSAATLWRMRSGVGPKSHVTCPRKRRSSRRITFHHAQLPDDEVTTEQEIPATTPARTLLDLAPLLPSPVLARMVEAAPNRGAPLAELLARYPRKPGRTTLAAVIESATPMTRSDLEAKLLDAMTRAGLPQPEVNAVIEGYEIDFAWRKHRVIAELDAYATHGSRLAFERDRERDRKLTLAGWRVVRMTNAVALDDLSRLLAASAARSRPPLAATAA